jgi:hypothetical protein
MPERFNAEHKEEQIIQNLAEGLRTVKKLLHMQREGSVLNIEAYIDLVLRNNECEG